MMTVERTTAHSKGSGGALAVDVHESEGGQPSEVSAADRSQAVAVQTTVQQVKQQIIQTAHHGCPFTDLTSDNGCIKAMAMYASF